MTINQVVTALQKHAARSRLGGETVVHVCDDNVPYREVYDIKLDQDDDGAVVLIKARVA